MVEATLKVRMSMQDAHYAGNLVDGARMLNLFGDVGTELAIRYDGDEGLFQIGFAVADACDPSPNVTAVLDVHDGTEIPVTDGQFVEFEVDDEGVEIEYEDGLLEIEAPKVTLRVTAIDASGKSAMAEVEPAGLTGDNDDDTLASAELDD